MPRYRTINTRLGPFFFVVDDLGRIARAGFVDAEPETLHGATEDAALMPELADELVRYFNGEAADFSFVPTPNGPPFFHACWEACRRIPAGSTASYRDVAESAGRTNASRAAGQAMRNNRLPVIIPCHRVVTTGGGAGGFGGKTGRDHPAIRRKLALQDLDRLQTAQAALPPHHGRGPTNEHATLTV